MSLWHATERRDMATFRFGLQALWLGQGEKDVTFRGKT